VKKLLLVVLMLIASAFVLQALEIPVSLAMEETLPYQKELRFHVIKAIADIENIQIVEPGSSEWFRVQVIVFEMKLENQVSVGYAVSYTIVEVPFYLHAYVNGAMETEKRQEAMDRLVGKTVFYHGADLLTVGEDGLPAAAERIRASLSEIMAKRIRIQTE